MGSRDLASAADQGVIQAKAAFGPSLEIAARHVFTAARIRGTTLPSRSDGFGSSAELTLSQPLFASGSLSGNLDAAKATAMIERERLRGAGQQLILDVVDAYVSLQRDIELQGVAAEIYRLLLQQREATMARYRLRDSTAPDLDQTVNRLEVAAGRVIEAKSAVEASAARYRNVVGTYPEGLAPLPPVPESPALETLYAAAEESSPVLAAAKHAEARSRAAIGVAQAGMRPQVNAFAAAARNPLTPYQNTLREESVTVGVSLTMALYTGGQQSSALREAIDRNLADQQFTEQARRDVRESLAADWNLLHAATEALPRYDTAVLAAERAVQGVRQQETSGIRTLRDVLEVTNDLLTARTQAVRTRAEMFIRHVAILRDAGLLTIESLTRLRTYDPDSRKTGGGSLAGLPLRPVVAPLDRLALQTGDRQAPVQRENSPEFTWPGATDQVLEPPSIPDRGGPGER